ncbi:hypothetical protein CWATWH8502_4622 [Crocosphaera watsonii WH 8502]|uniref:Uncharacterized protein n=4 Tax=Crocosphaera watsonii TaxID=263511 RepID=T2JQB2_CROWT|nr:hypothetical protein CWATWH8502_4622 [Crocosphaera watsonii WH 8502]CCQ58483.1 hypothetical protein CWATWH0005_4395 [Crocosphaera watsonii WH 0005]CCQ60910.1 hypothetical protein CWATWH0401_3525 [Crocosphaera watsonii WH 0401]CCQ66752.1 hypothetical protein CWATWH0402_184 [Crocosphaera watsonii WH 0402]
MISSDLLDLFLAEKMRNEVEYALKKRIKIIVNKTDLTEYLG